MSNEDGTVWVTFNGEIYNFLELRTELEAHGHRFATRSDTEVIVHAFEHMGRHASSGFAACSPSRSGTSGGGSCSWPAIGSARSLCSMRADGRSCSPRSPRPCSSTRGSAWQRAGPGGLDEYLTYGYIPAPGTAFRNVFKLPRPTS